MGGCFCCGTGAQTEPVVGDHRAWAGWFVRQPVACGSWSQTLSLRPDTWGGRPPPSGSFTGGSTTGSENSTKDPKMDLGQGGHRVGHQGAGQPGTAQRRSLPVASLVGELRWCLSQGPLSEETGTGICQRGPETRVRGHWREGTATKPRLGVTALARDVGRASRQLVQNTRST